MPLRCWQNWGLFLVDPEVLSLPTSPIGGSCRDPWFLPGSWVGLSSTLHSDLQTLPCPLDGVSQFRTEPQGSCPSQVTSVVLPSPRWRGLSRRGPTSSSYNLHTSVWQVTEYF